RAALPRGRRAPWTCRGRDARLGPPPVGPHRNLSPFAPHPTPRGAHRPLITIHRAPRFPEPSTIPEAVREGGSDCSTARAQAFVERFDDGACAHQGHSVPARAEIAGVGPG